MNQNHYNILKNNNLIFFQIKNSFKKYIKKKKLCLTLLDTAAFVSSWIIEITPSKQENKGIISFLLSSLKLNNRKLNIGYKGLIPNCKIQRKGLSSAICFSSWLSLLLLFFFSFTNINYQNLQMGVVGTWKNLKRRKNIMVPRPTIM